MSWQEYPDEQDRYHPYRPGDQYDSPTDMAHHQLVYPSRPPQSDPYCSPPSLPSGYPMNAQLQYNTDYYPQQGTRQYQTYPQPAAAPQYPQNSSQFSSANYHPSPTNIPNHPPPAYDGLSSPDEESPEQAEPISSEQVHDAEAFVDQETLGWIPSGKNNNRQIKCLEVRPSVYVH